MIYNRIGAVCLFDRAEYRVGDMVVATAESPWEGLYGTITEICDGDDRQTENGTIDLYCEFLPPIHPEEILPQVPLVSRMVTLSPSYRRPTIL